MVGQLEGVAAVPEAAVVVDALLVVHEVRVDLREEDEGAVREKCQYRDLEAPRWL